MFRKLLCVVLSLCVFTMTMPTQAFASNWGGDVIEIGQEGEFQPILTWTQYPPPAPGQDEMAYFAATDDLGKLWSVDVNLTKAKVTYVSEDGTTRLGNLSPDGVEAFRISAKLPTDPESRIQCLAHPACAAVVGVIITIGVAAIYFNGQCNMTAMHQARIAAGEVNRCNTELANGIAQGKVCSMSMQRQEAELGVCFGGSVSCSVHCSESDD